MSSHADSAHAMHAPTGFISKYIFSVDHKVIGIQYYLLALVAVTVGIVLSVLMRFHLVWPGAHLPFGAGIMTPEQYLALVTMHGTIMVFFVLTTAPQSGFGNYFLPIQIGAADMAFPRINMLSFWVTFLAFVALVAAFFVPGGAPISGWTAYAPLSGLGEVTGPGEGLGQTMWIVSIALFCIASLLGALNFIATTIDLRAPGMSLMRMPLTVWASGGRRLVNFGSFGGHELLCSSGRNRKRHVVEPQRRLADSLAAFVLVLRPSGSLHCHFARHGRGVAHPFDILAQADLWVPRDGLRAVHHRLSGIHGVGPSHVRERDEPIFWICILRSDDVHRRTVGHQDIQLARNVVGRKDYIKDADALRARLRIAFRQRGPFGIVPRAAIRG
jgi:hypothetical protein